MTTTTTDPEEIAHHLGVTIFTHLGGEKGRYYGNGAISLRAGLGHVNRRSTLAHELAHHVLRHDPAATGWVQMRQEHQADQLAAQTLITPTDYAQAERLYGPHPGAIAQELEVTRHLLHVWKNIPGTPERKQPHDHRASSELPRR